MSKVEKLVKYLEKEDIDAVLIHNAANVFYYSSFKGTNGALLITKDSQYLITDFRYVSQAKKQAVGFEILETTQDETIDIVINKYRRKHKIYKLGLEGDYISRNQWLDYERKLTSRLINVNIDFLREVKDENEVKLIKDSIAIAEKAFIETLKEIKVGMSEKMVARILENKMFDLGAEALSFDTIVASGIRGALPHGVASDKLIANNELITIDFGCIYKGYCSDITRTFGIGNIDPKLVEIYNIVLKANEIGIKALQANKKARLVDKEVRDYIASKGYGDNFGHGLGHSFGVEVHENPRLNQITNEVIQSGNLLTIEPGIYVDGLGGVRIEDDVLIKDDKIEVLTTLSKELLIIEED